MCAASCAGITVLRTAGLTRCACGCMPLRGTGVCCCAARVYAADAARGEHASHAGLMPCGHGVSTFGAGYAPAAREGMHSKLCEIAKLRFAKCTLRDAAKVTTPFFERQGLRAGNACTRVYALLCKARVYASRIFAPSASLRSVALRNSDGLSAGLSPCWPLAWRPRALKRCGASARQGNVSLWDDLNRGGAAGEEGSCFAGVGGSF